ncbi:hypothetical protein ABEB36_008014 [Hypothenemus hampei]|uniref:THAP-type domain-containing protein n=1 Tax=Hypothenemus hampei TaxID=57062 RepID=A0ABD1EKD7_HYPHA
MFIFFKEVRYNYTLLWFIISICILTHINLFIIVYCTVKFTMVEKCLLCGEVRRKGSVSLHKFPRDDDLRKQWIKFCKLNEHTDDVRNIKLCSNHFKEDSSMGYPCTGYPKLLRSNAVPSLYFNKKEKTVSK